MFPALNPVGGGGDQPAGRRPYPPEFKRESVELYRGSGRSLAQIAEGLGVATESLRAWNKRRANDRSPDLPKGCRGEAKVFFMTPTDEGT